jgi:hypothetical protein
LTVVELPAFECSVSVRRVPDGLCSAPRVASARGAPGSALTAYPR